MKHQKVMGARGILKIILSILTVVLVLFSIVLIPWNVSNLPSYSNSVQSYEQALARIEAFQAEDTVAMNPACRLQLMSHNRKVARAVILVHGYTNCPQQFHELGQRFYDLGYNVLIAPLPHHGLTDRMTDEQALLSAKELAAYSDETVDIAHGLGEQVTMMGISAGGVVAAWAAQNRKDLELAVIISPGFGFKQIPTPLTAAVMNIYGLFPDSFVWWDAVKQADAPPEYAYPRYSKHALTQILRLGFVTFGDAKRQKPAAQKMVVVLNGNDSSVNNEFTLDFVKIWQAHAANVTIQEFDASLGLGHDLIDPNQSDQRIDVVYPRLIEWAGN